MSRTKRMIAPALALALSTGAARAAADFTRYVAVGDSLTAAYCNGGLVDVVQASSYPALISRQATRSTAFEQPLVSPPGIAHLWTLDSLVPLVIDTHEGEPTGVPLNLGLQRPYDNLAVPGAKAHDVVATTSSASNPFFGLVLRGNAPQLAQAASLDPTFATVWIGNNDVLSAAVSGIVVDDVTLTLTTSFEADFRTIVDTLSANGAQLAIGTIPDVTTIPYVTTLPWTAPFYDRLKSELPEHGMAVPVFDRRGSGSSEVPIRDNWHMEAVPVVRIESGAEDDRLPGPGWFRYRLDPSYYPTNKRWKPGCPSASHLGRVAHLSRWLW